MRGRRILVKDSYYHVGSKVNRGEFIFEKKEVKQMFELVLKQSKAKFNYVLMNYVIMGNHFHLHAKPKVDECLSDILKWIKQTFACRYNRKYDLTGHVWGDRFFSVVLISIIVALLVFFYIALNPVRANLIDKPEDYRYGGYYHIKQNDFSIVDPIPEEFKEYF